MCSNPVLDLSVIRTSHFSNKLHGDPPASLFSLWNFESLSSGTMAGKGKHGLDRLFQEQGESHSRRTLMESWTLEQDEHLFVGINKYRRYGFSVEATMELMKKDIAFHTIFSDWPISVMVARFEALVAERRILPLVTNSDVVQWADLKGGESLLLNLTRIERAAVVRQELAKLKKTAA
ncbi:hypothetical protein P8452_26926 [Trifolium repens]|nr:hypothetical protein P8452_26926 [Trifolium repens]